MVRLWDRWTESSDKVLLLNGNVVIPDYKAVALLADDPSTEVVEKLNSAKRWENAGIVSVTVSTVLLILGLVGFGTNSSTGAQNFSTSTI